MGGKTTNGTVNAAPGTMNGITAGTVPCTPVFCKAQAGSGN